MMNEKILNALATDMAAKEAAVEKLRVAAQDVVDVMDGCDPDDPVDSVSHLLDDLRDALSLLRVLDGPEDTGGVPGADEEPEEDPDKPPECELCAGQGFGADAQGAVACPQCNGTGVQPEDVPLIDEE